MSALKVALAADYSQEGWPSMDLVAEMLATSLARAHSDSVETSLIRPRFARPLTRFGALATNKSAFNAERALNRYVLYPLWLRRLREKFDLFHIVDHSYSHLANYLPADRTIITCHDLDAFRTILASSPRRHGAIVRAISNTVLKGFRRAAMVTCVSRATRDAIVAQGLRPAATTVVIANGVDSAMSPERDASADGEAERILGRRDGDAIEIVHVGSTEPRKRIDLLLQVFAGISQKFPAARLIRVGGGLLPEHRRQASMLGIEHRIVTMPFLERKVLAAVYRRAAVVLLPSDAEGFALPVVEALACGRPVVASDIPVLREVGGDAVSCCRVGAVSAWIETTCALLAQHQSREQVSARIAQAARFSWDINAAQTVDVYRAVAEMAARKEAGTSVRSLAPTAEQGEYQ
ncbi:MAG TPA: glycosyltransferase [Candidatus Acidoferrales bacterium]|nr:glycosyltransferase [Candidatus Acidoferrales bacterium]